MIVFNFASLKKGGDLKESSSTFEIMKVGSFKLFGMFCSQRSSSAVLGKFCTSKEKPGAVVPDFCSPFLFLFLLIHLFLRAKRLVHILFSLPLWHLQDVAFTYQHSSHRPPHLRRQSACQNTNKHRNMPRTPSATRQEAVLRGCSLIRSPVDLNPWAFMHSHNRCPVFNLRNATRSCNPARCHTQLSRHVFTSERGYSLQEWGAEPEPIFCLKFQKS